MAGGRGKQLTQYSLRYTHSNSDATFNLLLLLQQQLSLKKCEIKDSWLNNGNTTNETSYQIELQMKSDVSDGNIWWKHLSPGGLSQSRTSTDDTTRRRSGVNLYHRGINIAHTLCAPTFSQFCKCHSSPYRCQGTLRYCTSPEGGESVRILRIAALNNDQRMNPEGMKNSWGENEGEMKGRC